MLERALSLHQAGRLDEAEQCYRQVLQQNPTQSDALHLMGLICHQKGNQELAEDYVLRAIRQSPRHASFKNSLGEIHRIQGKLDAARKDFQQAIRQKPDYAVAHANLGLVLEALGDHPGAEKSLRRAIALAPDSAQAHYNLGRLLRLSGKEEEALLSLRQCLRLMPEAALAQNEAGLALQNLGRWDEAIDCFRRAASLDRTQVEALFNLGNALATRGDLEPAIEAFHSVLRLNPQLEEAYLGLGASLKRAGNLDAALASLDEYLKRKPDSPQGLALKATVCAQLGRAHEAIRCLESALARQSDEVALCALQADCYCQSGELETGMALYEHCLKQHPDDADLASSVLFHRAYVLHSDPKVLYEAHVEWGRRFGGLSHKALPPDLDTDGERRLRLGYVSPDFRRDPIGFLAQPVLARHDHASFEVYCYSDVQVEDSSTQLFRQAADIWRDIAGKSDEEAASLIRSDRIDILVDLNGHTIGNRLRLFAHKPAPVQASWLGYFNTTGVTAIDYLLADEYSVPTDSGQQFVEEVMRLPHSRFCYAGPESASVSSLPAEKNGYVTFGSFNHLAKLNHEVIALWARILREVPHSRLVLKRSQFVERATQDWFAAAFEQHGIAAERIDFRLGSPHVQMLQEYGDIDIALDPFPYTGGMTSLEALWMGVPVLTMAGSTLLGRQSASFLRLIGLEQFIARDEADYCEIAVRMSANPSILASLRSGLRQRIQASPLGDCTAFTRDLERAYRSMWRNYCSKLVE